MHIKYIPHAERADDLREAADRARGVDLQDLAPDRDLVLVLNEIDFPLEHDGSDQLYYLSRMDASVNIGIVAISANEGFRKRLRCGTSRRVLTETQRSIQ